MLVASLFGHSWPPVPSIVFPDLVQHLTRGEGELGVSLNKSNVFLGLFHENIVSITFVTNCRKNMSCLICCVKKRRKQVKGDFLKKPLNCDNFIFLFENSHTSGPYT